jgi:hypothetical protein
MQEERAPAPTRAATATRLRELRAKESATRATYDPAAAAPWIDVSGADPYRLVPSEGGYVGILRGSRALVRLNADLSEIARLPLPQSPTALCLTPVGEAWVASRYAQQLWRVGLDSRITEKALNVAGVADLACGEAGSVYVLPADGSALLTLNARGDVVDRRPAMRGGLRLAIRGRYLLESSLFERSLRVRWLSARGVPEQELATVHHDGTLWAFDALVNDAELLIAVAGVEDKSLVRVHGEFENIDSFLWVYSLRDGQLRELAALNLSELGVVVPKAVGLSLEAGHVVVRALASGSGSAIRASFAADFSRPPELDLAPALPGVTDAVFEPDGRAAYASPLFDAWIRLDRAGAHPMRVDADRRPSVDARLGEALFFTELLAPTNRSEGTHSRFSCETCHFEGGVDGRIHYTGRADISVVTKPLFGLANNRPHFSRAQDPDLSSVSHNEFRVAGAGSAESPWFALDTSRFAWLHDLGIERARLEPLELRAALLDFLYTFSHAPNPLALGRSRFTELEARGAQAFAEHCQSCHAPRLLSDDGRSARRLEEWESLVLSRNAPLVWARGDYEKTGILPYVSEQGTRITSLRRLALKPRYFTNGSSPNLDDVLRRFGDGQHAPENADARRLSEETRRALLAFLQLL